MVHYLVKNNVAADDKNSIEGKEISKIGGNSVI
jgi:hypothetical protein